jgi:uncharacterized protein YdeI (BOF family)
MRTALAALLLMSGGAAAFSAAFAQTPIGSLAQSSGVTISGEVATVFGNTFVLRDATGDVLVDTGPRWHRQHSFVKGERLTVTGEMDDDDFDARRVVRADGSVLVIRPDRGPPPWAGRD